MIAEIICNVLLFVWIVFCGICGMKLAETYPFFHKELRKCC